jgi:hypothetical protein
VRWRGSAAAKIRHNATACAESGQPGAETTARDVFHATIIDRRSEAAGKLKSGKAVK